MTPPGGLGTTWTNLQYNWVGTGYYADLITVSTSLTALPLGSFGPAWGQFWNQDSTNYLQIQNSLGANFMKLGPGVVTPVIPLDPAFVPYVIANTASVLLFYALWSA